MLGDAAETWHRSSTSRYSRVSVDEMDIERMFEKTSSMDDQESSAVEDPLSPTDSSDKGSSSLTDKLTEDPQPSTDRAIKDGVSSSTKDCFSLANELAKDPLSPTV